MTASPFTVGIVADEFLDPALGRLAGFGWAARRFADLFNRSPHLGVRPLYFACQLRRSLRKVAFVVALEMREARPYRVRLNPVEGFSFAALTAWSERALMPGSEVTPDGLLGFEVLSRLGHQHQVVVPPRGKAGTDIESFRWLNVVLGNLKTALSGTHHAFGFRNYAHSSLADIQYRFNRRYDMAAMVPWLTEALMRATPRTARELRGSPEVCT